LPSEGRDNPCPYKYNTNLNPMDKLKEVESLIKKNIPDAVIEASDMTGDMNHLHLELIVASDAFLGKTILEQHKMVMNSIRNTIDDVFVHAVQLKTMTREKYLTHKEKE
jgi:acid stress-induced BolA-like protein IbaG/YrbA